MEIDKERKMLRKAAVEFGKERQQLLEEREKFSEQVRSYNTSSIIE